MRLRSVEAFLSLAMGAACALAQATPQEALLVLSKQAQTLAIVDPATLKVVARVPVGADPHEVIATEDGRRAYVSNYGFGRYHTLAVVDLVAQKALPAVELGALKGPHGLSYADGKVWFTAEAAKAIGSYDPATGTVDTIIGTGQNRTHMLHVFPGTKRIVTTNVNSGTVTVMDWTAGTAGPPPGALPPGALPPPAGDWMETVIPVGARDEGFDVSPSGREMWVGNAGDGTLSVIDLETKQVTATLAANVASVNRVKFSPDGRLVLVSLLRGPDLVVLDAATRTVIKRLPLGRAEGIQMDPHGGRAFVACSDENYVAVIDLKTLDVVGRLKVGGNPDGMAWAVRK